MSYLSNVRICVPKKEMKKIKSELLKIKSNIWNVCDLVKQFTAEDNIKYVIFGWNNIEWYLNYKDVNLIEQILKSYKLAGIQCKFINIGKDIKDIEQEALCENNQYII